MTMPDPVTVAAIACGTVVVCAVVCAAMSFVISRTAAGGWRGRSGRESAELREALEAHQRSCAGQLDTLSRNLQSLEASMQSADEILRDGRLNLSARAQALQLIRTGISPDTAAASLGVANRDIRLLAKVSRLLSVR